MTLSSLFTLLLVGCGEQKADISSPHIYQSDLVEFGYPGNWEVADESALMGTRTVSIESPGDAIVIYQSYPRQGAQDLKAFASEFSFGKNRKATKGGGDQSPFSDNPSEHEYQWLKEDFEISVFDITVPHRRIIATRDLGEKRIFLTFQAATEDWENVLPGFELIWNSLRRVEK